MSDPLRARLTALEVKLRAEAAWKRQAANERVGHADAAVRDDGIRQEAYAAQLLADADKLAALLHESELASREAAEYPNQAGQSATEPARRKPALDAASLTHILATWKEHSHPPPMQRRRPCPACGILIDLANLLRETREAEPPELLFDYGYTERLQRARDAVATFDPEREAVAFDYPENE